MREIEIKARVVNKQALITKLKEQGVVLGAPKTHHDVVLCKPGQKDYEKDSVWLRVRTEDGTKITWTMKVDTGRKLDSIEYEVDVSNAATLEKMLRRMGNEPYSDLTKTRQKGKWGDIEICVDTVDGLGTYIEAEKLVEDHNADYDVIVAELWGLLGKLGITKVDQEVLGYDVLLRQKH